MKITTRHTPAFGVARLELAASESVRIQSGAMMAMSPGMNIEARMEGGLMRALKRAALGGESFFLTTCTAPANGGWVDVAAQLPGDLTALEVTPAQGLVISRGAWLCSPPSVEIDTKWGGFKNLFGSEGGFIVRATGSGPTVLACYGAIETWALAPGESLTVDTGHMVAYDDSVTMQLRKIAGGVVQSAKSGEGLVFDFTGPGRVLTQTRNPNELLGWIAAAIKPTSA